MAISLQDKEIGKYIWIDLKKLSGLFTLRRQ
jgi:hypothetical protein